MKQIIPANKGVDAILFLEDKVLAGQKNASLSRRMSPINITNKITGEWSDSLSGVKSWSVTCSGVFIKDEESFDILENAFNEGTSIMVKLSDGNRSYQGKALITSFPISANYNDTFTYNIGLTGIGELI